MFAKEKIFCLSHINQQMGDFYKPCNIDYITNGKFHYTFGRLEDETLFDDLLKNQLASYSWFISKGLSSLLENTTLLELNQVKVICSKVIFDEKQPVHGIEECILKGLTYEAPLYINLKFVDQNEEEKPGAGVGFKYLLGNFPIMTEAGGFIINGKERTIVNQMVLNNGVYFIARKNQKALYGGVNEEDFYSLKQDELEKKLKQILELVAKEEKKKKNNEPKEEVAESREETTDETEDYEPDESETVCQIRAAYNRNIIFSHTPLGGIKIEIIKKRVSLKSFLKFLGFSDKYIESLAIKDCKKNTTDINRFKDYLENSNMGLDGRRQLQERLWSNHQGENKNVVKNSEEAEERIFQNQYTDRLTCEDLKLAFLQFLVLVLKPVAQIDLDSLSNRRVRRPGDQLKELCFKAISSVLNEINIEYYREIGRNKRNENQTASLTAIKNWFEKREIKITTFQGHIRRFFAQDSLCQFVDQTNPLASLSHKRTITAMGTGGLKSRFAGVTVRDAHKSFYGRICPVETPEGANIGLVNHLALYSSLNEYGMLGTKYYVFDKDSYDGTNDLTIKTFFAGSEHDQNIIQAEEVDKNYVIKANGFVKVHKDGQLRRIPREEANLVDISPKQTVGVSASLVPFLAHDDARRALMACNMMRQSLPCGNSRLRAPIVSTGMELKAAVDGRGCIISKHKGMVTYVSSTIIKIKSDKDEQEQIYKLPKLGVSNSHSLVSFRPTVYKNDVVDAGQVIADGTCTDNGELALGRNVLVAYMPWDGYNFEDAILISEDLVQSEGFSSVYIERFDCDICEDFSRKDALGDCVKIGQEVKENDVLVARWTKYKDIDTGAEADTKKGHPNHLRLKGHKGGIVVDVIIQDNDAELNLGGAVKQRVSVIIAQKRRLSVGDKMAGRHGNKGVISKILPREDMPFMENGQPVDIVLNPLGVPSRMNMGQLLEVHLGWVARALGMEIANIESHSGVHRFRKKLDSGKNWQEIDCGLNREVECAEDYANRLEELYARFGFKNKEDKLPVTKDLETCKGVQEYALPITVPVFDGASLNDIKELFRLALLGRRKKSLDLTGNKKAKLNIRLKDETLLELNCYDATFKICTENNIKEDYCLDEEQRYIVLDCLDGHIRLIDTATRKITFEDGKIVLYDGRTGEAFKELVTVGVTYFLKLNHMAADTVHGRSIGAYSEETDQPVQGAARGGGLRFGEMEAFALSAYGAKLNLQEMRSTKSDNKIDRDISMINLTQGCNRPLEHRPTKALVNLFANFYGLGLMPEYYTADTSGIISGTEEISSNDVEEINSDIAEGGEEDER